MTIIRITKAQIEKANKARQAALSKDVEYRLYDERQQLWRQAAIQRKVQVEDAATVRPAGPTAEQDPRHGDERRSDEGEAVARKKEQER